MPDEDHRGPYLTLRVVYKDLPDLIEVEARVATDGWSGVTRAYTSPQALGKAARELREWAERPIDRQRGERPAKEFVLEAGADAGVGWLSIRCYLIHRVDRLACQVRMATSANDNDKLDDVWRLNVEFCTDPSMVECFAQQLASLAETRREEATLTGQ